MFVGEEGVCVRERGGSVFVGGREGEREGRYEREGEGGMGEKRKCVCRR